MQTTVTALAAMAAVAQAAMPQGFNYGATGAGNSAVTEQQFEDMFKLAQNLPGTDGAFNSARLYTMMTAGSSDVTGAIPAAIATKTNLLLGMWVSDAKNDSSAFDAELAALKSAVSQYGDDMKNLVVGISVGSEDLYRITPQGLANPNAGYGQNGSMVSSFIQQTKDYLKTTQLSGVPVGHVDTWTAWAMDEFSDVVAAADFLGVDAYPEWQTTDDNTIDNAQSLFNTAVGKVKAASQGKEIWITETGWGVNGPTEKNAIASVNNAKTYWDQVGCANFGKTPTFWYTLEDGAASATNPDFSIYDASTGKPYFDLSCKGVDTGSNSTSTSTASGSTSTGSGSSTGSNSTVSSGSPTMPSMTSVAGSGSGSSGSGSSTGSSSGTATSAIHTAGAASMGIFSAGSLVAIAAAVAALL